MVLFDIMYYNSTAYSFRGGVMTYSRTNPDLSSSNSFQLLHENIPFETYEASTFIRKLLFNLQVYVRVRICMFRYYKTAKINN